MEDPGVEWNREPYTKSFKKENIFVCGYINLNSHSYIVLAVIKS